VDAPFGILGQKSSGPVIVLSAQVNGTDMISVNHALLSSHEPQEGASEDSIIERQSVTSALTVPPG